MKLVIFDLDQTLVDIIFLHDETTGRLFQKHFGVDARLSEIDFAGKSLLQCFEDLARLKGIPAEIIRQKGRQLIEDYENIFLKGLPLDISKYVLPGVRELLEALSRTENMLVLYTGGSRRISQAVLLAARLDRYFKLAFFGTEVERRADMVRLALDQAGALAGRKFVSKDIVIIGDSVRDVACGQEFDALTIAVATGFHSVSALKQAGTDFIFSDLSDYAEVIKAINSK